MHDAVEASVDLRGDAEIQVLATRFADAVLQQGRRIAGRREHAHHHAAIVARPDRAIGRERIGPVALVAVDGRRSGSRGRVRVREQAAEERKAGRGKSVALATGEGVDLAAALEERLMQIQPLENRFGNAGRHMKLPEDRGGARSASPRRGTAPSCRRRQVRLRAKGELALARAEFDLERAQRHVERNDAAPDRRQGGIE